MYAIKWAPDFDRWFDGIRDRQTRIRLLRRLEKAQRGLLGDVAPVGDGVYEMREFFGPDWRMDYVQRGAHPIVMRGGGFAEGGRDQADALQGNRAEHGAGGCLIRHGGGDLGAQVDRDADRFGVFAVADHPVAGGESPGAKATTPGPLGFTPQGAQSRLKKVPNSCLSAT
jgi:putative addiction module killer protein